MGKIQDQGKQSEFFGSPTCTMEANSRVVTAAPHNASTLQYYKNGLYKTSPIIFASGTYKNLLVQIGLLFFFQTVLLSMLFVSTATRSG
jgi:hypothetical protein